ncbi:hypothetical protein SCHPADRAFT_222074 [Schizopora paradoxa]|uniref:Uncharacterized protein n=1 Tax=Schizopora paradoxa TaxID=27342 RepID=A0A0H2RW70_9AGAM|nr:hypothetical protein SCHPADRAFT_222074 [Schizopora paradoxa]
MGSTSAAGWTSVLSQYCSTDRERSSIQRTKFLLRSSSKSGVLGRKVCRRRWFKDLGYEVDKKLVEDSAAAVPHPLRTPTKDTASWPPLESPFFNPPPTSPPAPESDQPN